MVTTPVIRSVAGGFVLENTTPEAEVITDEAVAYKGIERKHKAVKHYEED